MLHAIKPMIWQALQTLREHDDDIVKRSKLQVLTHNLSADGVLAELVASFDANISTETDKVECRKYLDTAIHEAVTALKTKTEKEKKFCVERVHEVCWQLCKIQLKGNSPALLTEESTKIWWKIFNAFSERDSENQRTVYPVCMDWEEVDYWANVVLKIMALPTNTQSRKERDIMGSTVLNFQDALVRFSAKLNENNGMYVLDQQGKPDLKYIEHSMQELNVRLFEGIHLNGSLLSVKRAHAHTKWCVLYQMGLAFADSAAEVDSTNTKAFILIGANTEVTPLCDKNQRPVRFQLSNGQDPAHPVLLFEANNVSVRNKWITAIICLKHGKLPDYEKDFINRRKARIKNREFDAEAKETLRKQKEKTKKQVEEMTKAMEQEKQRHNADAESLRSATAEQLQAKIAEHDCRMESLMRQMTELGHQYELEKATVTEQHEREIHELVREHGDQIWSVQTGLESELARVRQQIEQEREEHQSEISKRDARIGKLEEEVARLNGLLDGLKKQMAESGSQYQSQLDQATGELTAQLRDNSSLRDEAEKLGKEAEKMRERIKRLEEERTQERLKWDDERAETERLNAELKTKADQLEAKNRALQAAKESMEKHYEAQLQKYIQAGSGGGGGSHRGPGFDAYVGGQRKE